MKFLHIYITICVILFTYAATNNNVVHANKIYQRNQVNKHNLVKNLIVSSTNNKQHNSKVDTEGPKVEIPKPTSTDASKLPMAKTDTSTVVAQDKNWCAGMGGCPPTRWAKNGALPFATC